MKSHRVVWTERFVAQVEGWEVPEVGDGQVLVRSHFTLISPGTERAWFLNLPNTPTKFPQYPGYSAVGRVVHVGAKVQGVQVGDRVVWAGRHAAHAVVSADAVLPVPSELSDEEAAFFNLAAIAMQGVRKARIELGESVVVIGVGLIGLLAMQLAKLNGAIPAIAVDRDGRRLQFAQLVGADATFLSTDDLPSRITHYTTDSGAHVVIDATGDPEAIPLAFQLARWCGRVVLLASPRGETKSVNFYRDVHRKGLVIIGAHDSVRPRSESSPDFWTAKDDRALSLRLLTARRLQVKPLITHRFAWADAPKAYDLLAQWDLTALGILLDWREEG